MTCRIAEKRMALSQGVERMNKPLLAAGAFFLAGLGTAGVVYVASSGGEEEVVQQIATATPGASASTSPSPSAPPSPSPSLAATVTAAASASPQPVPEGWLIYSDPHGRFELFYPPTWYVDDLGATFGPAGNSNTHFSTYEPGTIKGGKFPRGAVKVDLAAFERREGLSPDCAGPPPVDSTAFSLGGAAGWRQTVSYEPTYEASESGITHGAFVVALHDSYCFTLSAYFAQDDRDTATFDQLVLTFKFKD